MKRCAVIALGVIFLIASLTSLVWTRQNQFDKSQFSQPRVIDLKRLERIPSKHVDASSWQLCDIASWDAPCPSPGAGGRADRSPDCMGRLEPHHSLYHRQRFLRGRQSRCSSSASARSCFANGTRCQQARSSSRRGTSHLRIGSVIFARRAVYRPHLGNIGF